MKFVLIAIVILTLINTPTTSAAVKGPPRITQDRNSVQKTYMINKDIKLSCPIDGTPAPIFEWRKGDETIPEDSWERFRVKGNTLAIKKIGLEDQGDYFCSGVNGFGSEKFTFHVTVLDPLPSPNPSNGINKNNLPHVEAVWPTPVNSEISRAEGHSVKFKCQISGNPEPEVRWYKNGELLVQGSADANLRILKHTLHIVSLTPTDSGNYTCTGFNLHGVYFYIL